MRAHELEREDAHANRDEQQRKDYCELFSIDPQTRHLSCKSCKSCQRLKLVKDALSILRPRMLSLRHLTRLNPKRLSQPLIINQPHYRFLQLTNISRLNQQRRLTIHEHFANLPQSTRNNPFPHRHILKDLRRRSKELTAIREGHMRRDQYVASIKQTRHAIVADRACKDHSTRRDLRLESLLNLDMQAPASHQQKPHRHIRWNQLDRFSKLLNAVPRSKRADKPRDHLIVSNPELTSRLYATNTRSKAFHINAIRIYNNLLRRDATPFEVPALNIGDDKNTRRSVKVQSLVSLEQIETADAVPMPAHPNLGAVVLEKQRPLRAVRSDHTSPAKSRISLINEIGIGLLDQRHGATCKDEVVMNFEKCACTAAGLRRDHRESICEPRSCPQ